MYRDAKSTKHKTQLETVHCKEDAVCFCELGTEVWPAGWSQGVVFLCNSNVFMAGYIFMGN